MSGIVRDDASPTSVLAVNVGVQLYRMHDLPGAKKAAIPTTREEARYWNAPNRGFGIFLPITRFIGARRKENLVRINAVAIDIDEGTKVEQWARLEKSPLVPTSIVETKRGYQAYWRVHDVEAHQWNSIVLERLVPFFGADPNARDLCRLLRAPGFLHLKDPADPFMCRIVARSVSTYRAAELIEAFPQVVQAAAVASAPRRALVRTGVDFWSAVAELDCEEGLRRLSGDPAVRGEQFSFRPVSNGHLNVLVDGKLSSCFIDADKRIGSSSKGGPTIYQWLRWYGRTHQECIRVLTRVFPELERFNRTRGGR